MNKHVERHAKWAYIEYPSGERQLFYDWHEVVTTDDAPPPMTRTRVRVLPDDWEQDDPVIEQEMMRLLT